MAIRSVGEAAATGLESGLNLGLSIANASRDRARQDRLDAEHTEDRNRLIERQRLVDQGAALDAQAKELAAEGTAMEASATKPTPEAMDDYTRRASALKQARGAHFAKISGIDVAMTQKAASQDIDQIMKGNLAGLPPGGFTRALTVATGQDPAVFVRAQDGTSPIEQAGKDFMDGLQSGDKAKLLAGANMIFGPKVQKGVGEQSPHGGKIVRKEIADVVPDPNAKEGDPRFIPVLKVYVDRGEGFKGPRDEYGATSSYTAPLTEGRATGPDAKVKSLSPKDVMDFVGQNLHVVELLNQPEGLAKLQEDQQSGAYDPQGYFRALQGMNVMPAKATVKETVIPAGASLNRTTTDARTGKVIKQETIQGNVKTGYGAAATMQAKLDAVDEAVAGGDITDAQGETEKRAIRSGIRPGKYTGDGAAGGGGSGGGDRGISAGENRRLQRLNDSLKGDQDTVKEDKKEALRLYEKKAKAAEEITSSAKRKAAQDAAESEYRDALKELKTKDDDIAKRRAKVQDQLDGGDDESIKSSATKAKAAAPAASKAPVLKFDKQGNRVMN